MSQEQDADQQQLVDEDAGYEDDEQQQEQQQLGSGELEGEEGEEGQQQADDEAPKQLLRFCPESNHILYPRENRALRRLEYYCKNCAYWEAAPRGPDYCVYVSEHKHDAKEQTVILQDVASDPTLPRTREVTCPSCQHNEAVFFSASSEQGMTLYFNCMKCEHRWRDYV